MELLVVELPGIKVDKYYASEIDKYAIKVAKTNYPDIIELGDINNWHDWEIEWDKIDLIIGGSPCQDFSTLSRTRNGLNGTKSNLFYVFRDILNFVKIKNPRVLFLLENNASMPLNAKNIISNELKTNYININSKLVCCGMRNRLYWTNIPNITIPDDKDITIQRIIEEYGFNNLFNQIELVDWTRKRVEQFKIIPYMFCPYNMVEIKDKFYCLTAEGNSQTKSSSVICYINNKFYMPNALCWEIIQTLPLNYTKCLEKEGKRKNVIGNGWTVDVIAWIFSFIPNK